MTAGTPNPLLPAEPLDVSRAYTDVTRAFAGAPGNQPLNLDFPKGYYVRLLSIHGEYQADATAVPRVIVLSAFGQGPSLVWQTQAIAAVTAGQLVDVIFAVNSNPFVVAGQVITGSFVDSVLPVGGLFMLTAVGGVAGDSWAGDVRFYWELIPFGAPDARPTVIAPTPVLV